MAAHSPDSETLLTPSEVATLFRVDPKTVTRWAKAGKLTSIRTLGGHRRRRGRVEPAVLRTRGPGRAGRAAVDARRKHSDEEPTVEARITAADRAVRRALVGPGSHVGTDAHAPSLP